MVLTEVADGTPFRSPGKRRGPDLQRRTRRKRTEEPEEASQARALRRPPGLRGPIDPPPPLADPLPGLGGARRRWALLLGLRTGGGVPHAGRAPLSGGGAG